MKVMIQVYLIFSCFSDLLEPELSFLFTKEFLVQSDLHQREDSLNLLSRKITQKRDSEAVPTQISYKK